MYSKTGRPGDNQEVAAPKILKALQMIEMLQTRPRTVKEIAERFDMSTRSVYRYVNLFDAAGFIIDKDFEDRYFITHNPQFL